MKTRFLKAFLTFAVTGFLFGCSGEAQQQQPEQQQEAQQEALVPTVSRIAQALTPPPAQDSGGKDFWLGFPRNYTNAPELTLFITGSTATTGTVQIPGLNFSKTFTVTPGQVTPVVLPNTAQVTVADGVENKGIHVTAVEEVVVYGLSRIQATTDAYLGLPTDILGTDYVVMSYQNTNVVNGSQFSVVATQDNTVVTITPKMKAGARAAGVAYNITLNQGQSYQLQSSEAAPSDLTGSTITSTKPIAVYGSHQCANIPDGATYACDFIVEQMPPTTTWGKSFVTVPLATRTKGDTFRFLAAKNNTVVKINGNTVATLNRGAFYQTNLSAMAVVTSSEPILVAQFSNGTTYDNVTSDPFMMLIPPYEQFLAGYTVTTPPSGFSINYVNVVAPNSSVGQVKLDGANIPASAFTAIGTSGFSGAKLPVANGTHNLTGPLPFGVFMYGFDNADSYGYPGGMSLSPIAVATSLTVAPKTGTAQVNTLHCVTATVRDQFAAPVNGVRVDFAVSGANSVAGFANTNASGEAPFCYTGLAAGNDAIKASLGTLNDSAAFTWTAVPAEATSISLAPKTGTGPVNNQHCVTATVLDQYYQPFPGAYVNFVVTGAHDEEGQSTTNASGQATYCYTGTNPGSDNILAYLGELSDTASYTWEGPPPDECIQVSLRDYNLFLLEDYNLGTDVEGKVAAGGNITMNNFAVGSRLPDNDIANTLVAGGNLTLTNGGVWGDIRYGGTYSADQTVTQPRGDAAQGSPIDFAARGAQLRQLSAQLNGLAVNGTTTKESWGGIMLTGTDPNVNVFTVKAEDFTGAKLFNIDAPAGSMAIINITGAAATFQGFGINFAGGIDEHGVLFNFTEATSIYARGFGFWGTVLAPYAHVDFSEGSWDGGMYAKSLTGYAEGHINPLNDRVICPSH